MLTSTFEERATVESPAGPVLVRHPVVERASKTVRVQLRVLFAITALWAGFSLAKASLVGIKRQPPAVQQISWATHRVIEWNSVENGEIRRQPAGLLQERWTESGIDVIVEPVLQSRD